MLAFSLTLAAALVGGVGCGVRHIREAQDAFSRGALAEQAMYAQATAEQWSPFVASGSPAAGEYAIALSLVERELNENAAALKEDGLYGNALVLKALCIWRLTDLGDITIGEAGDRTKLDMALDEIRALPAGTLGTRDRVLAAALPGLRDHDRGLRQSDYARAQGYFTSAIEQLDEALRDSETPARHPVRVYVHLAQLRTCRAWLEFAGDIDDQRKRARDEYTRVMKNFAPLWKGDAKLYALVSKIAKAMGENDPQPGP
jgi:hypothetical protein